MEVKLFIGAAEVLARLRLIGAEKLRAGEDGWLQLELRDPVVAVRGDRYILRRPSPGETLGGGSIVDPRPRGRHKRFSQSILERFESLSVGSPADILSQAVAAGGIASLREAILRSSLEQEPAREALDALLATGEIVILDPKGSKPSITSEVLVTSRLAWEQQVALASKEVEAYHRTFPLRQGMPREELKSRLKTTPRVFTPLLQMLIGAGILVETGPLIYRPGHTIRFSPKQEASVQALLAKFTLAPYAPPTIKECQAEIGADVFDAMVELETLHPVSTEVVFRREDYEGMLADLRRQFQAQGVLTAAQVRDHFSTSRRYVLALLEHLDAIGITIREGDARRLR
jgi:selenocysteine-specific elongation factor